MSVEERETEEGMVWFFVCEEPDCKYEGGPYDTELIAMSAGGSHSRKHRPKPPPKSKVKSKPEKEEEAPPGRRKAEEPPEEEGAFFKPKTPSQILEAVLDEFDVKEKAKDLILARSKRMSGLHPQELEYYLTSLNTGLKEEVARFATEEYNISIQRENEQMATHRYRGSSPFARIIPQHLPQQPPVIPQPGQPPSYSPQAQYWPQQPPPGFQPPGPAPAEEKTYTDEEIEERVGQRVEKILTDHKRTEELNSLADAVLGLREEIREMKERPLEQPLPGGDQNYVYEEVPVNAEGNLCPPEEAFTFKRVARPLGSGGSSDPFQAQKEWFKMYQEMQPPKEDPQIQALEKELEQAKDAKYDKLKDDIEKMRLDTERARVQSLENQIDQLGESIKTMPRGDMAPEVQLQIEDIKARQSLLEKGLDSFGKTIRMAMEKGAQILGPDVEIPEEGQWDEKEWRKARKKMG